MQTVVLAEVRWRTLFSALFQRSQSLQPVTHADGMFQPKPFRENNDLARIQGQGSWSQ